MKDIHAYLQNLGRIGKDCVTGIEGVIESVTFDLYGCIQYLIRPKGQDEKDGSQKQAYWYDEKRINFSNQRVMDSPAFADAQIPGPASKPDPRK